MHDRPQHRQRGEAGHDAAGDHLPAQAAEEDHVEAGRRYQQRGAQVGLARDEAYGHCQQQPGHDEIDPAARALAALEVPGQHQGHGDLHQLGGLDARHAEVQPAPRALGDVAEQGHRHQQCQPERVGRHRGALDPLQRQARGDPHDGEGDEQVARVVAHAPVEVERRRVHGHQAHRDQQRERRQQGRVEHQDVRADASQQRGLVVDHGLAGSVAAAGSGSTMSSGMSRSSASSSSLGSRSSLTSFGSLPSR